MEAPASEKLTRLDGYERKLYTSYSQVEMFQQCPLKWYYSYVEGLRSGEKQEALSYGKVMHSVMEVFFKNGKRMDGMELSEIFNFYLKQEDVPWESPATMLEGGRDAGLALGWLLSACHPGEGGDATEFDRLIREGTVEGVEERFSFPYRLPTPATINGRQYREVQVTGSVDLILSMEGRTGKHYYAIDWKTGRKPFDAAKLGHDLQHPIYAAYMRRAYGALPRCSLYFFLRFQKYQECRIGMERLHLMRRDMDEAFSAMYGLSNAKVDTLYLHATKIDSAGNKRYYTASRKADAPMDANMEPKPSPLCYYCEFGKHKRGICPYSSGWTPEDKIKRQD